MNILTYTYYIIITSLATIFTIYWLAKILVCSIKGIDPSVILPDVKALRLAKGQAILAKIERDKKLEQLG